MDTAQVITLAATMLGFVAVLVAIFAVMCQLNSRYSRLNAKLDTTFSGKRESTANPSFPLSRESQWRGSELRSETRAIGVKVSDEELEKAWQEGVNSVLASQMRRR